MRDRRAQQNVHATGQRQIAVARVQCLAGLMDGHQRRTARGIHRHRRSFQSERERDPTRDDIGRIAGDELGLDGLDRVGGQQHANTRWRPRPRTRHFDCRATPQANTRHVPGPPTRVPASTAAADPSTRPRAGKCRRTPDRIRRSRRGIRRSGCRSCPAPRDPGRSTRRCRSGHPGSPGSHRHRRTAPPRKLGIGRARKTAGHSDDRDRLIRAHRRSPNPLARLAHACALRPRTSPSR